MRHLHAEGLPILTLLERSLAPGVVVRPLTDPVPLYPWTMVFHRELRHPGLDALHASIDELALREDWHQLPPDTWIPGPDAPSRPAPSPLASLHPQALSTRRSPTGGPQWQDSLARVRYAVGGVEIRVGISVGLKGNGSAA